MGSFVVGSAMGAFLWRRWRNLSCDLAERQTAEKVPSESEERLVRYTSDIVTVLGADGTLRYGSPSVERVLGYRPEERIGANAFAYIHPDDAERVSRALVEGLDKRGVHPPIEVRFRHSDGSWRHLEVIANNLLDDPNVEGIVLTSRDITERKKVEERLLSSQARNKAILDASPDLIFLFNRAGEFLDFKAAGKELWVAPEAIIGSKLNDVMPAEIADAALLHIARALDTGEVQVYEYRLPVPDDGIGHFEARLNKSGANEVLAVVRNMTARKRFEEALRRQNEYLSALHETTLAMMHRLELSDLLKVVVARAGVLMGTPHGYVYLREPGEAKLQMRVGVGVYEEYIGYRLNPGEGLAGKVWESGQSLVVEDYAAWEGHSAKFVREDFRAVVGVPLKSGSEVVGVIGLAYFEEDRAFGNDELALLTRFAELASVALDNARLYASAQQELAERERAEKALGESEEQYRMLVETVQEGIGFVDAEERITYCNLAYAEIFELAPEELTGRSLLEFLDEEGRRKALAQTALRKNGVRSSYEITVTTGVGNKKHLSASGAPVMDEGGRLRGAVHTIIDITESKRAEALLLQQSTAIENSIDGMAILNADGEYVYLNEAHVKLYGYDEREELLGKGWEVLYDEEQIEWFGRHIFPALREHDHWRGEAVGRKRDGGTFPQELSISALKGGGFVCLVRDITERRRAAEARRESEERFRHLIEQAADALFVHDLQGRFVDANQKACDLLGYTKEELLGLSVMDIEENFDPAGLVKLWERVADKRSVMIEGTNVHKDGRRFPVEIHLGWFEADGERLVLATVRDVTERKQAEYALKESEKRFRQLFEQSVDALFVHDATGRVVDCNSEACRSLGYSRKELLSLSVEDFVINLLSEEERSSRAKGGGTLWQRAMTAEPGTGMEGGLYLGEHRRKDATTFPVEVRVGAIDYSGRRMIFASARDITERKAFEDRLEYQAFHDPLTDLPNRTLFMEQLEHALARAQRHENMVAVLFLDLDNFKIINDSLGHEMGDQLLTRVAGRLRACLRPADTVARLAGDEFTVLLEDLTSVSEATRLAERIAEELRTPFALGKHDVFVTSSIGLALSVGPHPQPGDLLRDADTAMYQAKNKGKAQYEVFESSMNHRALERLKLESDLRRALQRDELKVCYQPKIRLDSGRIVGVEALVRWEHPERGLVPPVEFIPVAEETGLIIPLRRLVLEEACRQASAWQRRYRSDPPIKICVNLSARQFQEPDLVEEVAEVLRETGLESGSLELEITEDVAMKYARSTIATLQELKGLSVTFAIDDFGTGYSSLSYLKSFPVDTLKIDKSFIDGLGADSEDAVLVSAIIDMAHALGLQIVAEGVETAFQLALLRGMGCDLAQGNYFAKPLSGESASTLLENDLRR